MIALGPPVPGANFETCVRRAVSSHSAHHLQVHLTQLSLFVNKCSLQPHSLILTVRFAFLIACPSVCLFVLSLVLSLVGSFFFHSISVCPLICLLVGSLFFPSFILCFLLFLIRLFMSFRLLDLSASEEGLPACQ